MSPEQREVFFSACGEHCVKSGTLQVYRELHAKAGGDLDVFFLQANELPGVKAEIVEKDSLYHLYFMECTCGLFRRGYVSTPLLCECSRQSILYVAAFVVEGPEIPGDNLRLHFAGKSLLQDED